MPQLEPFFLIHALSYVYLAFAIILISSWSRNNSTLALSNHVKLQIVRSYLCN